MAKLILKKVRISYPDLFTPKAMNEGDKPRYAAHFLIPKGDAQIAEVKKAMQQVAKEKWADKAKEMYQRLEKGDKLCLRDGDAKEADGYEGHFFVSAARTKESGRPDVRDRQKNKVSEDNSPIYAGCFVNAVLDVWAMDNKYGKRICAKLLGVQFVSDGDAFVAGSKASDEDFEDLEDESFGDDVPEDWGGDDDGSSFLE